MELVNTRKEGTWKDSDRIINDWLNERQQLIVLFNRLSEQRPFTHADTIADEFNEMVTFLIDYVSAGQFQVFETIFQAAKSEPALGLNPNTMVQLLRTTNAALDFAERYRESVTEENLAQLEAELSDLGEWVAVRMDLEDRLIELYSKATHLVD